MTTGPQDFSFVASLTDKGQALGFYDDGRARLVLETDVKQLRALMKLVAFGRRTPIVFNVHIERPSEVK